MVEQKVAKGSSYLLLGIVVFVSFLLIDAVIQLTFGFIFGSTFMEWDYQIQVLSRILPAVSWVILFLVASNMSTNKLNFNFFHPSEKVTLKNYLIATFFLIIAISFNYASWGDFKLLIEYNNAGTIGFFAQHIYYFAEIIIVTTLVVLFQKMCEAWFKNTAIPYGGIAVAITWGLAHIFTQNSIAVGLLAFVYGIGFGSTYLILKRNYKLTTIFLFLMFVL